MNRRFWTQTIFSGLLSLGALPLVYANSETPDAMVKRVSGEVIEQIKTDKAIQAGDVGKIIGLVDAKVMPNVNFGRMTASAVGRHWRQATPEQQKRLQDEFKALLIRTYSGAMAQIKEHHVITVKPLRAGAEDTEVIVRSEIKGRNEPIQLDYRAEKTADGWKIYDINVLGIWLVETYRGQFANEISSKGIDGLINTLSERNKGSAKS